MKTQALTLKMACDLGAGTYEYQYMHTKNCGTAFRRGPCGTSDARESLLELKQDIIVHSL